MMPRLIYDRLNRWCPEAGLVHWGHISINHLYRYNIVGGKNVNKENIRIVVAMIVPHVNKENIRIVVAMIIPHINKENIRIVVAMIVPPGN